MTSTTALPVELTARIMDSIGRDRRALLACSKLASSWRPGALARLFRSIQIRDGFTVFSFGVTRVYGATHFKQFRETMPHLLLHLRHLTFWHSAPEVDRELYDLACQLRFDSPYRVEAVTFSGTLIWYSALDCLATRFPALQRLTIESLWNIPAHDLPALNASCWDVGLAKIDDGYVNPLLPGAGAVQTALRNVTLRTQGSEISLSELGSWLSALHGLAPGLQSVGIVQRCHVHEEDVAFLIAATKNCAHLIETVELWPSRWKTFANGPEYNMNTFIGHCARLRFLDLNVDHRGSKSGPYWATEDLPQLTGPFPLLERLNVILHHSDPMTSVFDELPLYNWHELDEMLLTRAPHFGRFVLTISPFSPGRNELWRAAILRSAIAVLPGLHDAGKLEVAVANSANT